jgi:hypothetical protein
MDAAGAAACWAGADAAELLCAWAIGNAARTANANAVFVVFIYCLQGVVFLSVVQAAETILSSV